jgi:hypothetical protein
MQTAQKFNSQEIELLNFEVTRFNTAPKFEKEEQLLEYFSLNQKLELSYNLEEKISKVRMLVKILALEFESETKCPEVNLDVNVFFYVDNLDKVIAKASSQYEVVPYELNAALVSLAYSTTRGYLIHALKGTIFSNFYLPAMNASELLELCASD